MVDTNAPTDEPQQVPLWIDSIQFADGTTADLQPGHVVVLVGPNNVGKSQTLRNIDQAITSRNHPGYKVAKRVSLAFRADRKDCIREWVTEHVPRFSTSGGNTFFSRGGASIQQAQFEQQLDRIGSRLGAFGTMMTLFANAEQRLQLAKKSSPVDVSETAPTSPVQALYGRSNELDSVSEACKDAFGQSITYDHLVDGMWRLRLGEVSNLEVDRHGFPTTQYRNLIRDLPAVDEQGDGLRSYVGLLAEFLSSTHLFVLLDEPEAFLHPPQARLLGRHIVEFKSDASQLVVATHDANFLRGVLDATPKTPVTVIRLQRVADSDTTARILEPTDLRELWEDPVLRYSNILEGLFHHGVIVCEADPDCRLYESVIQAHDLAESGTDFMFAQSGGVERVHTVVGSLRAIGVPTQVILDADTTAKPDVLERIVHALGEDWSDEGRSLQQRIAAVARDKASRPSARSLRSAVDEVLRDLDDDDELNPRQLATLNEEIRPRSGWEEFKRYGLPALKGEQYAWGREFLDQLSARGVHLVPTGELESWFPDAPNKGARHVRYVHEHRWHEDTERSASIVSFLKSVVGRLPRRMSSTQ